MQPDEIDFHVGTAEPVVITTARVFNKVNGKQIVQMNIKICYEIANQIFKTKQNRLVAGIHESGMMAITPDENGVIPKRTSKALIIRVRREFPEWIKIEPDKKAVIRGGYYYPDHSVLAFYVPDSILQIIPQGQEALSSMNKSTRSLINSLNGVEQKVYEAMPMLEPWTTTKLMAELKRRGHNIEDRTILRCARELCEKRLATEGPKYSFQRKHADAVPLTHQAETNVMTPNNVIEHPTMATEAETIKKSPMELLANLASRLREFADDLDSAALEIEQEFQASEARSEKLKQLQTLLKGITN